MADEKFIKSTNNDAFSHAAAFHLAAQVLVAAEQALSPAKNTTAAIIMQRAPKTSADITYKDSATLDLFTEVDFKIGLVVRMARIIGDKIYAGNEIVFSDADSNDIGTSAIVDQMVSRGFIRMDQKVDVLKTAFDRAKDILTAHKKEMDAIVQILMAPDDITGEMMGINRGSDPELSP